MDTQLVSELLKGGVIVVFATFVVVLVFRFLNKREGVKEKTEGGSSDSSADMLRTLTHLLEVHAENLAGLTLGQGLLNEKMNNASSDMKNWTLEARSRFEKLQSEIAAHRARMEKNHS